MPLGSSIAALRAFYGRLAHPPRDPFALFVWQVLSAETSAPRRHAAYTALRRLPALTPDAMTKAPPAKVVAAVALAGPYRDQRLAALSTGADRFRRHPELPALIRGPIRAARRALTLLPKCGESDARWMLLYAADSVAVPLDSRIARVGARLGYAQEADRLRKKIRHVQRELAGERCSARDVRQACLYLAHHGTATCTERDPHCHVCPLLDACPHGQQRVGLS